MVKRGLFLYLYMNRGDLVKNISNISAQDQAAERFLRWNSVFSMLSWSFDIMSMTLMAACGLGAALGRLRAISCR